VYFLFHAYLLCAGVQYHPELKSRPNRPSPPLFAFAAVACGLPDQLSRAGAMWREYGEGMRKEIAWIYSPASGLKKRPVSAVSSPAPLVVGEGAGSPLASSGVKRATGTTEGERDGGAGGAGTGGYKLSKLDTLAKYE
jgi:hypothetical protein